MSLKKRMDWYGNVRYTICFYFSVYLYTSSPLENKIIFYETKRTTGSNEKASSRRI